MSVQFSDLLRIAGITILLTVLWAASIAFVFWDNHRRGTSGIKTYFWLALVALLPFIGWVVYIIFRIFSFLGSLMVAGSAQGSRRETGLKQPIAAGSPTATLVVSTLVSETIAAPEAIRAERPGNSIKYVFTVSGGPDQGKAFVIENFPALIGRGSDAAIRLDSDLGVSRKHAEIYEQDSVLRIHDLQSTHGTLVNGVQIEDQSLKPGDQIQVGLTILIASRIEG
jgi:hypothetical protein